MRMKNYANCTIKSLHGEDGNGLPFFAVVINAER